MIELGFAIYLGSIPFYFVHYPHGKNIKSQYSNEIDYTLQMLDRKP